MIDDAGYHPSFHQGLRDEYRFHWSALVDERRPLRQLFARV